MRGKAAGAAALGLVGAFVAVGPGVAGNDEFRNKYESEATTVPCNDGASLTFYGPEKLWPPNHKMQPLSITASDGGDVDPADEVTLTVTPRVDDAMGGDGGAQHGPDVSSDIAGSGTETVTVPFEARSERSGRGDGRTYEFDALATFDNGFDNCSHTFIVTVPHDMRGGADW